MDGVVDFDGHCNGNLAARSLTTGCQRVSGQVQVAVAVAVAVNGHVYDHDCVESADIIVAGTPVYKGAYTGQFKHLFDLLDPNALVDVPVVLAATGGSERHSLMTDHTLRPLFSFFRAHTVPTSLYATASQIDHEQVRDNGLRERIQVASRQALHLRGMPIKRHVAEPPRAVSSQL